MEDERLEYVTNAFHELKSPLTTIMLAADIIKMQDVDCDLKDMYLNMISGEVIRMKNLINNTINSLKNNYFDIDLNQICDINQILETIVKNENLGGINLYLMASRHIVKGNLEYLESAFRELIENARKYKSERDLRIDIKTINKGDKICISFSDNGIGIEEDKLNLVFEKGYSRNESQDVENQDSTGVGLYFLKRNLQRINGAITIESKEGRGSVFKITLPIIV